LLMRVSTQPQPKIIGAGNYGKVKRNESVGLGPAGATAAACGLNRDRMRADGGSWLGQIGDPMLNEKKRHSRD
jgi:hypothetical protein